MFHGEMLLASLRWNHLFNDRLFVNTTAVFTDYNFAFEGGSNGFNFRLGSGIRDINLKQDYTYYHNSLHNFKFGWNYTFHRFVPSSLSASSGDVEFNTLDEVKIFGNEYAVYFQDEWDINEDLKINVGFRLSAYQHIGLLQDIIKTHIAELQIAQPLILILNLLKLILGQSQDFQQDIYCLINPLLSLDLPTTTNIFTWHLFHRFHYLHVDLWFPSTEKVKPQVGTQYSIGYFRNFLKNNYEVSVEAIIKI